MARTMEGSEIKMAGTPMPELVQLSTDLLWVNSPKDWILKSTYFQGTLFITMLVTIPDKKQPHRIRRNFSVDIINERSEDLQGLAMDCIDQMKTEINN